MIVEGLTKNKLVQFYQPIIEEILFNRGVIRFRKFGSVLSESIGSYEEAVQLIRVLKGEHKCLTCVHSCVCSDSKTLENTNINATVNIIGCKHYEETT